MSRVRTERSAYSATDFEKEIFNLSEIPETKKILLHGDSNTGKTALAGSLPGRNFWLLGEPGYKTAAVRGAIAKGAFITDTAKAWAATDWLEGISPKLKRPRYTAFDWVVLDGASTMEKKFRRGYAAEAWDRSPETKRARAGRNLPDRPDYFNTQNFMQSWIGRLVDLPVNLLITAHSYRTDRTDAELLVFPGFQGGVTDTANAIAGLMDVTGYMAVRPGNRYRTLFRRHTDKESGTQYWAGDKFGLLPPVMDNPTMAQIISILDGEEQ
jgi:hypothetical protein